MQADRTARYKRPPIQDAAPPGLARTMEKSQRKARRAHVREAFFRALGAVFTRIFNRKGK